MSKLQRDCDNDDTESVNSLDSEEFNRLRSFLTDYKHQNKRNKLLKLMINLIINHLNQLKNIVRDVVENIPTLSTTNEIVKTGTRLIVKN